MTTRHDWTPLGHPFPKNNVPPWLSLGSLVLLLVASAFSLSGSKIATNLLPMALGLPMLIDLVYRWKDYSHARRIAELVFIVILVALPIYAYFQPS